MSIKIGDCIAVRTTAKSIQEAFGETLTYKVIRKEKIQQSDGTLEDGFFFEMIGGTGPRARIGYGFPDTLKNIENGIANGTIKIVDFEYAKNFSNKAKQNPLLGVEID